LRTERSSALALTHHDDWARRALDAAPLVEALRALVELGKSSELETREDLKPRIEEASHYVDLDQLCLSPQCGFSSTSEGNALTEEQQWDKLRLIVETAKSVWG
jgi:hypothetical protein